MLGLSCSTIIIGLALAFLIQNAFYSRSTMYDRFLKGTQPVSSFLLSNNVSENIPNVIYNQTFYQVFGLAELSVFDQAAGIEENKDNGQFYPLKITTPDGKTRVCIIFDMTRSHTKQGEPFNEAYISFMVTEDPNELPIQCAGDAFSCIPPIYVNYGIFIPYVLTSKSDRVFGLREIYGLDALKTLPSKLETSNNIVDISFGESLMVFIDIYHESWYSKVLFSSASNRWA